MKGFNYILVSVLSFVTFLFSCSTNEENVDIPIVPEQQVKATGTIAELTEGFFEDENLSNSDAPTYVTRSSFLWDDSQQKYLSRWTDDDIVVYSEINGRADYKLTSGANSSSATFSGGGFDLIEGDTYYAFSNYGIATSESLGNSVANRKNIHLDYGNQIQIGNGNSEHLGAFTYQAATAVAQNHFANFAFKHVGSVFQFNFVLPEEERNSDNITFTKLTLLDYNQTDGKTRMLNKTKAILDLTASLSTNSYSPYVVLDPDAEYENITLDLKSKNASGEIVSGITISKDATLQLHVFFPSLDMRGQVLQTVLETDTGAKYHVELSATNFVQGKFYRKNPLVLIPSSRLDLTIKLDPKWKLGNTIGVTRADAGDPGYGKMIQTPRYLYPFVAMGAEGELLKLKENDYTYLIDTKEDDWDTETTDGLFHYKHKVSVSFNKEYSEGRVYIVASDYELDLSSIDTESGLIESSFNLPMDSTQQSFLENLYSTPYTTPYINTIKGLDTGTPTATAILYHVATKVDVQWDATNSLSGSLFKGFEATDLRKNGYLFKPTENPVISSDGTYYLYDVGQNVSEMYAGRHYFYAIQQGGNSWPMTFTTTKNTNVTTTKSITFTPSTENGWTSWLKANITIE